MKLLLVIETFLIFELCEAHLKSRGGLVPNEKAQSELYGSGNQSREFEAWLHFGVAPCVKKIGGGPVMSCSDSSSLSQT